MYACIIYIYIYVSMYRTLECSFTMLSYNSPSNKTSILGFVECLFGMFGGSGVFGGDLGGGVWDMFVRFVDWC